MIGPIDPPDGSEARPAGIVHVEMDDGRTFCGERGHALKQDAWHRDPTNIQKATCDQCLLRIVMCGDSASIALRLQGKKVDIIDVDSASLAEN